MVDIKVTSCYLVHDLFELFWDVCLSHVGRIREYTFSACLYGAPVDNRGKLKFDQLRNEVFCVSKQTLIDSFLS